MHLTRASAAGALRLVAEVTAWAERLRLDWLGGAWLLEARVHVDLESM